MKHTVKKLMEWAVLGWIKNGACSASNLFSTAYVACANSCVDFFDSFFFILFLRNLVHFIVTPSVQFCKLFKTAVIELF